MLPAALLHNPDLLEEIFAQLAVEQDTAAISRQIADLVQVEVQINDSIARRSVAKKVVELGQHQGGNITRRARSMALRNSLWSGALSTR